MCPISTEMAQYPICNIEAKRRITSILKNAPRKQPWKARDIRLIVAWTEKIAEQLSSILPIFSKIKSIRRQLDLTGLGNDRLSSTVTALQTLTQRFWGNTKYNINPRVLNIYFFYKTDERQRYWVQRNGSLTFMRAEVLCFMFKRTPLNPSSIMVFAVDDFYHHHVKLWYRSRRNKFRQLYHG